LQCVVGILPPHVVAGKAAEFLINGRHQLLKRTVIALTPGEQQLGYFRRIFRRHFGITISVKNLPFKLQYGDSST